ncbi:unnamed protein product, partial [Discosporangium mesarthrocarpum]
SPGKTRHKPGPGGEDQGRQWSRKPGSSKSTPGLKSRVGEGAGETLALIMQHTDEEDKPVKQESECLGISSSGSLSGGPGISIRVGTIPARRGWANDPVGKEGPEITRKMPMKENCP